MMTKVMVVKTWATGPKSSGWTHPKTGPMTKPMIISSNTSGMRFLLKISVKRCAAKMSNPIVAITKGFISQPSFGFHSNHLT